MVQIHTVGQRVVHKTAFSQAVTAVSSYHYSILLAFGDLLLMQLWIKARLLLPPPHLKMEARPHPHLGQR